MSDCISRQAAIDALREEVEFEYDEKDEQWYYIEADMAIGAIERLPSAQPERMRGRWQEITASDCSGYDPVLAGYDDPVVGYVCSVCHEGYEKEVMGKTAWDYCPNCGSYNGGEQDE